MKRLVLGTLAIAILISFSGCSHKYFVQYLTIPKDKNTKVYCDYENGKGYQYHGYYPTLYNLTNKDRETGILHLRKCKAQFGDSYTELFPTELDINKYPNGATAYVKASKYTVKYDSLPRGASVVCENNIIGKTPIELAYYSSTESTPNQVTIKKCKAIWSNGISKKYPTTLSQEKTSFLVQMPRSKDYKKIQTDYENNIEDKKRVEAQRRIERNRIAEQRRHNRRIEAQEDSRRTQQALDGLNKQLRDITPKTYNVNVNHY